MRPSQASTSASRRGRVAQVAGDGDAPSHSSGSRSPSTSRAPSASQPARDRAADRAAGAGDDRRPALEAPHHEAGRRLRPPDVPRRRHRRVVDLGHVGVVVGDLLDRVHPLDPVAVDVVEVHEVVAARRVPARAPVDAHAVGRQQVGLAREVLEGADLVGDVVQALALGGDEDEHVVVGVAAQEADPLADPVAQLEPEALVERDLRRRVARLDADVADLLRAERAVAGGDRVALVRAGDEPHAVALGVGELLRRVVAGRVDRLAVERVEVRDLERDVVQARLALVELEAVRVAVRGQPDRVRAAARPSPIWAT